MKVGRFLTWSQFFGPLETTKFMQLGLRSDPWSWAIFERYQPNSGLEPSMLSRYSLVMHIVIHSYLYLFIVNHSYLYLFIVIQCDLEDVGINPWCSSPKTARTATERSPATALLRRSVRISSRRWGSGWIGNDRNLKRLKSWTNIGDSIESIIHRIGWWENLQENPKKLMVKTVVSG